MSVALPQKRLTIQDVADYWSCSYKHVWSLIEGGKLPAIRLGTHTIRIRPEDIERFENEGPAPWGDQSSTNPTIDSGDTAESITSAGQTVVALKGAQRGHAMAAKLKRS